MSRLGIVVGVSENVPPLKSLAACGNDAAAMAAVLRETSRFDDILSLSGKGDTASKVIKERLTDFVEKHRAETIEELLFYFSGHGTFVGDEFYHILSDYDAGSRNQTSLANSELDGMMRGLSPALFVKIVDACHSGTSYIKKGENLGEYLKATAARTGFKDVYFLYSSQSDEPSWTAGSLSAFTKSILTTLARQSSGIIRYRDLISAASDHFEAGGGQKPQFVTQAGYTEVFCQASSGMQKIVASFLPKATPAPAPASPPAPAGKSASLIERIRRTDENYCSREEAIQGIQLLHDALVKAAPAGELGEVFSWDVAVSAGEPKKAAFIGEWLVKHADRSFFAKPVYRTESYKKRVPKDLFGLTNVTRMFGFGSLSDDETKIVDATRQVVAGYENTAGMPFDLVTLRLEPKFKSVTLHECLVAPLVSATDTRLFWALRYFYHSDWDTMVPAQMVPQWESEEAPLKDAAAIAVLANRIASSFIKAAKMSLESKWPEPPAELPPTTKASRPS